MRRIMTAALALVFCGMGLIGCTTSIPVQKEAVIRPWPSHPGAASTEKDIMIYINEGYAAYQSCKAAVED